MEWIMNAMPSFITGIILLIIIALIIRSKMIERKQGGCNCGCPGCSGKCQHSTVSTITQKETHHET